MPHASTITRHERPASVGHPPEAECIPARSQQGCMLLHSISLGSIPCTGSKQQSFRLTLMWRVTCRTHVLQASTQHQFCTGLPKMGHHACWSVTAEGVLRALLLLAGCRLTHSRPHAGKPANNGHSSCTYVCTRWHRSESVCACSIAGT